MWYLGNSVAVRRDSGAFPGCWTSSTSFLFPFSVSAPLPPQLDKGAFFSSGFNLIIFLGTTLFVSCLTLKYWVWFILEEPTSSSLSGSCFMPSGFSVKVDVLWRSSEASFWAARSCCSSRLFPEQFLLQKNPNQNKQNPPPPRDLVKTECYTNEFKFWGTSHTSDSSKQGPGIYTNNSYW